jgi:hypothetical protein
MKWTLMRTPVIKSCAVCLSLTWFAITVAVWSPAANPQEPTHGSDFDQPASGYRSVDEAATVDEIDSKPTDVTRARNVEVRTDELGPGCSAE